MEMVAGMGVKLATIGTDDETCEEEIVMEVGDGDTEGGCTTLDAHVHCQRFCGVENKQEN